MIRVSWRFRSQMRKFEGAQVSHRGVLAVGKRPGWSGSSNESSVRGSKFCILSVSVILHGISKPKEKPNGFMC